MLTALLATRNGARTLPNTLEAFCRIREPRGGWKLVVVDNASTDQTPAILRSFSNRLPLTYAYEARPGKNAALNTGLQHVEGDIVALTDDDIFPRADWLTRLRNGADTHPEYSIFGGVVKPMWEVRPPRWSNWIPPGPTFATTNPDLKEGPVKAPGHIYGANMAVRSEIFANGVRFDTSIGPCGSSYPMGSETELIQRLLRQGYLAWHICDAVVENFIRASQMRQSWVFKRAVRFGRGQYRLAHLRSPFVIRLWMGSPGYLYRRLFTQGIEIGKAMLAASPQRLIAATWELNYLRGQIIEARALHKGNRPPGLPAR
jgi:glycosyltransferase involved in cell wall biosynthesis